MQRGFTKLFNTIVTSTIWCEDDKTRIVWVTMLAIADAFGMVSGSIPGLAAVARVSVNACEAAIKKLMSPDKYSRTKDADGRRIVAVDGGWIIINYTKYRQMLNAEERAEYKRAWARESYQRKKSDNSDKIKTSLTQAEAEEEADKKKKASKDKPSPQSVEEWLTELQSSEAYKRLNVRALYAKMEQWCKIRNLHPTKRRFINWLNKEDIPLPGRNGAKPVYGRNYAPPPREPTEAELEEARAIARQETENLRKELNR